MHQDRSWLSWFKWPFQQVHTFLLEQPLRQLYFKGPALLGFWSGLTDADICTALNPGTSALFWTGHSSAEVQCAVIVEQRFHAFFVSINVILYAYLVYRLITTLAYYHFVVKPALKKMEQLFKQVNHVDSSTVRVVRNHSAANVLCSSVCRDFACKRNHQTPGDVHDPAGVGGSK